MPLIAQDPTPGAQKLAAACNAFARDLHGKIAASGRPTCSPASVALALGMLLRGARGATADEIGEALHLPADLRGEALDAAVQELLASLRAPTSSRKSTAAPQLQIADDLWVGRGVAIEPAYEKTIRGAFGGSVESVDFATDAEAARARINEHVARATNGRIRDLLSRDLVTADTRLVLTNALWWKARWAHTFHDRATKDAPFTLADGTRVDVATMNQVDDFLYAESASWQRLTMLFEDSWIACEILLPRPGKPLAEVEAALFDAPPARPASRRVRVALPRFRVEAGHDLKDALQALGIRTAFTANRADFSGITRDVPLVVDFVVHRTWIAVDEGGAEAAAATAAGMTVGARMPQDEPVEFTADRPFAFVLRDRRTGLVLFVARVTDPRPKA